MSDKTARLPNATVARIAKSVGEDVRVSGEAVTMIGEKTELYIEDIARKALTYANHASRKTIKQCDVEMVFAEDKPDSE